MCRRKEYKRSTRQEGRVMSERQSKKEKDFKKSQSKGKGCERVAKVPMTLIDIGKLEAGKLDAFF